MNEKKVKILVLTSSFPRNTHDWWAQFILNIYKFMDKQQFEITILAPHAPGSKFTEEIEGVKIVRFPYFFPFSLQKLTSGSGILHSSRENLFARLQIFSFILSELIFSIYLMLKHKFDLIHSHWVLPQGFIAVICKYLFNRPVVVTVHGSDVFALQKFTFFKRFSLKNSDMCTTNSSATQRKVKELNSETKIRLIPMGVDTSNFLPKIKKEKTRKKLLLAVGRLIRCKGFDYAIRAMPRIINQFPDSKLLIIGRGPEEANLRWITEKVGLRVGEQVVFKGALPHSELSLLYRSGDICFVPSITDPNSGEKEAQSLIVLEALASGLSVVASDSGGIKDVVEDSVTGLLTREKDYNDIAEKSIFLLKDKDLQRRMIENGLKIVREKYSWTKIAEKFEDIYKEVLDQN